ncbi:UDP-N-acetylmuramoyl-tripeptide--D-alanyl-D-alanine ligase [Patescibacteria group bacterium]|nr:UDP-N-acetylmuramoyl-tripeptide--D-alanyl-D-alanine ligase [Patescibacteria group bacterium]
MKEKILKIISWKLRLLARLTIAKYKPAIVGVTGNVGKTSAKLAIAAVLGSDRKTRASAKNFNNELGLPLNIIGDFDSTEGIGVWFRAVWIGVKNLILTADYPEVLVLEYGVDRPGDMNYLLSIAKPQIGAVTAVGRIPVHVEFFSGPEGVAKEKSKLVSFLPATGFAILNADDPLVSKMTEQTRAHVITFGFSPKADLRLTNFKNRFNNETGEAGIAFKLNYGGASVPVRIDGVFGKTAAYASAVAAAAGLVFGMNLVKISESLGHYAGPAGRLRAIPGIHDSMLIDDTYNASPHATAEAALTLKGLPAKRRIAVLGDMLELGKYTMEAHQEIGRLAAKSADLLVTVGTRAKFIAEAAGKAKMPKKDIVSYESVAEAAAYLSSMVKKGDLVLLKGSQGVRMEKVVKALMAEPLKAKELLVRQSPVWLAKPGLYE